MRERVKEKDKTKGGEVEDVNEKENKTSNANDGDSYNETKGLTMTIRLSPHVFL